MLTNKRCSNPNKRFTGGVMRDLATDPHELVKLVGGPMLPGEKTKGYLRRVAQMVGLTYPQVRSAYYQLWLNPEDAGAYWKLREAAEREQAARRNRFAETAHLLDTAARLLAETGKPSDRSRAAAMFRSARLLRTLVDEET